ncbi:hypothetical protein BLNAU_14444 [Blattamonas nauphoetae]|uniref:Uncharacterized protein n=1 Tax=Blattamonas nauphoetae TaxID=2049346 RepID=A0ABQ9XDS5_9EUKA|nr:hypothetical protein BLNAU_14444 [Blattamonas nauphoetae]
MFSLSLLFLSCLQAQNNFFNNPGFDNYNPYDKKSDKKDEKEEPNPWAKKFGGVWNDKETSGDDFKNGPTADDLSKTNELPLKELWETTKNPFAKQQPEGWNFKMPDEFSKPVNEMGRSNPMDQIFAGTNLAPPPTEKKPEPEEKKEEVKPAAQPVKTSFVPQRERSDYGRSRNNRFFDDEAPRTRRQE